MEQKGTNVTQKSREDVIAERIQANQIPQSAQPKFQAQETFLDPNFDSPIIVEKEYDSGNFQFEFPIGYIDKEGRLHRGFNVRPMTGKARKELGKAENRKNGSKGLSALIKTCISEIEGLTQVTEDTIRELTIADRDYALLKIREVSVSDILTLNINCPKCEESLKIDVNINKDLDYRKLEDSKFELDGRDIVSKFSSEDNKTKYIMRLPTGIDQEKIMPFVKENPIEGNYRLLSRCLVEYNGQKHLHNDFVENLSIKEIDFIERNFVKDLPGYDLSPMIKCEVCGAEVKATLDVTDFLSSTPQNKQ